MSKSIINPVVLFGRERTSHKNEYEAGTPGAERAQAGCISESSSEMHPSGCVEDRDKAGLHQTQSIGGKGMIAFAFFITAAIYFIILLLIGALVLR